MKNIVIIGAGKEGKAYLGEVYDGAGWHVTFLDKDNRVVESLKQSGSYCVTRSMVRMKNIHAHRELWRQM